MTVLWNVLVMSDSDLKQKKEEEELLIMETDQKIDQKEMIEMEEALLSEYGDEEDDNANKDESHLYYDSPYPSDTESDDEEEFEITDCLKDWVELLIYSRT